MTGALPARKKPNLFRRAERAIVGFGMGIGAYFIEKMVMRSIKKGGGKPKPAPATQMKSTGGQIESE